MNIVIEYQLIFAERAATITLIKLVACNQIEGLCVWFGVKVSPSYPTS
jgi:hypothetical protein